MSKLLPKEMDKIRKNLLDLVTIVEECLAKSIKAFENMDLEQAQAVIESDHLIDEREVDLEEDCLKVLALHQPVASDLRMIIAILKINNDLERIGDLAVNISRKVKYLVKQPPAALPNDFSDMAKKTQMMLRKSLDAFVNNDPQLAYSVCASDDEVDAINRKMYTFVKEQIRQNLDQLDPMMNLLASSKHLERIADYATNIAEDVIYIVEGSIIRHRGDTKVRALNT